MSICFTSSSIFAAPAPEAAWYVMVVIHSTRPALKSALAAISIKADGAVAAGKSAHAAREAVADDVRIHGIENDHGFVAHAQRGGGVDPVALPSALAQRRVDFGGVFAALAADQHVARGEIVQIRGVAQRRAVRLPSARRRRRWTWRRKPAPARNSRSRSPRASSAAGRCRPSLASRSIPRATLRNPLHSPVFESQHSTVSRGIL